MQKPLRSVAKTAGERHQRTLSLISLGVQIEKGRFKFFWYLLGVCAHPLMSFVLEEPSFSGTPAIFLNTLQENECISLLLSQSFSVSATLTFPSILPHRLLLSLSSSNMFCALWPPWEFFWRPDWGLTVPFPSPTERSKFSSLLSVFFFPVIFAYYAVAVFHVAILNCYTDHPEQGKNPVVLTVILYLQCKIGEHAGLETPCSKSPDSYWEILAAVIIVTVSNLK